MSKEKQINKDSELPSKPEHTTRPLPRPDAQENQIVYAEYQGPLPIPQHLEGYGQIDPTFPDRIVKMAESEQVHRYQLSGKAVEKEYGERRLGQIFAFIISIFLITCSTIAIIGGYPVSGTLFGGGHASWPCNCFYNRPFRRYNRS